MTTTIFTALAANPDALRALADEADQATRAVRRIMAREQVARRQVIGWTWLRPELRAWHWSLPDYTRGLQTGYPCGRRGPAWFRCTRITGHTGRHAEGALGRIVAVWGDR